MPLFSEELYKFIFYVFSIHIKKLKTHFLCVPIYKLLKYTKQIFILNRSDYC